MALTGRSTIARVTKAHGAQAMGLLGKAGSNFVHYGTFGTVSIDPPNILANTTADVSVTIPGVSTDEVVILFPPAALESGLVYGGSRVTALDTVSVRIGNVTVGAINGASRSWVYVPLRARMP